MTTRAPRARAETPGVETPGDDKPVDDKPVDDKSRAVPFALRARRPSLARALLSTYLRLAFSAVSLAAVSLILVAWIVLRSYAADNLMLLARSMAYTVEAAVVFNDSVAAQEAIAMIADHEDVAQVVVTDVRGEAFVVWQRADEGPLVRLLHRVSELALRKTVTVPVMHNGTVLGQLEVRGRGHQFSLFVLGVGGGVLACLAIILGIGTLIARHMHRDIVAPLRALADVAHAVRRDRVFGRRVQPTPIAELHELGEDFNALLDEFETWQHSLREQNASLAHQANHDGLTGLPNRAYFDMRLEQAIADAQLSGTAVGVLFIDGDRFKDINDTLGHAAGDAVLVAMAARLRAPLRKSDLVARLGGDEFVVMLPGVREVADAARIAQTLIDAMRAPIALPDGRMVTTTVSVGIAFYPQHARGLSSLLRSADAAMYEAKRAGPGVWRVAQAERTARAAEDAP
jgi:diguanylate cyclase (GGDEF)-like protein